MHTRRPPVGIAAPAQISVRDQAHARGLAILAVGPQTQPHWRGPVAREISPRRRFDARLPLLPGCQELHRRLKHIEIQVHSTIQFVELLGDMHATQMDYSHDVPHDIPILLLDIALIRSEMGPSSRQGDLFLLTVGKERLVDEFSSIVSMRPKMGKGKRRRAHAQKP